MSKILKYELKRLLLNKFFYGLLAITLWYSWQLLSGDIILGVSGTAPFSAWSYGTFLSRILPLLIITLLFFVSFYYSKQEQQVQALTLATPIKPQQYRLVRLAAISIGFCLLAILMIGLSFCFYGSTLHFYHFTDFLSPLLLVIIPAFCFSLGLGMAAGKIQGNLIYVLMLLLLILCLVPLPDVLDFSGTNFFASYPLSLALSSGGEPNFTLSGAFMGGRIAYTLVGLALLSWGLRPHTPKTTQAD